MNLKVDRYLQNIMIHHSQNIVENKFYVVQFMSKQKVMVRDEVLVMRKFKKAAIWTKQLLKLRVL